ncbi:hypothetical protein IFM89_013721 [Coptis chinensis]|uniref:Endonuclease/exonuclease/phosphatase domain-containing protein n=1 Tax=Coptis chinensis TaxID=261450 RepID=A0A835LZE0_9MAGN|nr:hypothetical protein IFM89_013721 [Coptis chinensis]
MEVEGSIITIIHAHCISIQRRQLWAELQHINNTNLPWLLMGDFNAYLSCSEKQGGKTIARAMNDLRECVSTSQLMEVPSNGFHHTWWNKQVGRFKIVGKLDRMFCNAIWSSKFPGWNYKVCNRVCSDHSPLVGRSIEIPRPKNVPFKFFNMWCSHPSFREVVQQSWEVPILGHSIFALTQKLKRLKGVLKRWNRGSLWKHQN